MSNIFKIFSGWLEQNKERFNHKPILLKKTKKYVGYLFENINPMLQLIIRYNDDIYISVEYNEENYDMICSIDTSVTKNQDGFYYCSLCESESEPAKLYKRKEDLLAEHSFEVLLEWVNEKFIPANIIRLYEHRVYDDEQKTYVLGATAAEIINKEKAKLEDNTSDSKILTHDFPVINVKAV